MRLIHNTAVFILLASILVVPLASANSPSLEVNSLRYEPQPAETGGYTDLFLKVENNAVDEAEDTVCVLEPTYPFTLEDNQPVTHLNSENKAVREIGILPGHEEAVLQYRLRVSRDAVEGWNRLDVKCKSGSGAWVYHQVPIKVNEGVRLGIGSVKSSPLDLKSDMEDARLDVEIKNLGETGADMIDAQLKLPEGIEPSQSFSDRDSVGSISEGDSKDATFRIDTAEELSEGVHEADLELEYEGENGNKTETFSIPIRVVASPSFEVEKASTEPGELSQGDQASLRIKVKNKGSDTADSTSLRVYKESGQPFDFDEKYDYVGDLAPGETGEAVLDFTVDGDADLKSYLLDIEIRHVDGEDVVLDEKKAEVEVEHEKFSLETVHVLFIAAVLLAAGGLKLRANRREKKLVEYLKDLAG